MRHSVGTLMRNVLLVAVPGLLLGGCRAALDPQCARQPSSGANFGTCSAVVGAYYNPSRDACVTASGCECDETCRQQVPFETIEACRATCEGPPGAEGGR